MTLRTPLPHPLRPALLAGLGLLALAACRPGPQPQDAQPAGPGTVPEATATAGQADPVQDDGPNPAPVGHPAISVTLHPDHDSGALALTQAMGQSWLPMKDGDTLVVCVANKDPERPALVSVSVQGKNIDLTDAHPTRVLQHVGPQTTRCLPQFTFDPSLPRVMGWYGVFAEGKDGASLRDPGAQADFSGLVRLEEPRKGNAAMAWPGLLPDPADKAAPKTEADAEAAPDPASQQGRKAR